MRHAPAPLDLLLSAIPSLPRAALDQLVTHAIDRMDQLDPDPDLEDGETGNHLVDERGRWCLRTPPTTGPWYEDDEEPGDLEGIDEREPESEHGEYASVPPPDAHKSLEAHRARIRRTRCVRVERPTFDGSLDIQYRLSVSTRSATLTMLRRRHHPRQRNRRS